MDISFKNQLSRFLPKSEIDQIQYQHTLKQHDGCIGELLVDIYCVPATQLALKGVPPINKYIKVISYNNIITNVSDYHN